MLYGSHNIGAFLQNTLTHFFNAFLSRNIGSFLPKWIRLNGFANAPGLILEFIHSKFFLQSY